MPSRRSLEYVTECKVRVEEFLESTGDHTAYHQAHNHTGLKREGEREKSRGREQKT